MKCAFTYNRDEQIFVQMLMCMTHSCEQTLILLLSSQGVEGGLVRTADRGLIMTK